MQADRLEGYDVVVIGGGPGGYAAAIRAGQLGGRVALVEMEELGGVCLNEGCIPTKFFVRVVEVLQTLRKASELGVEVGQVSVNMEVLSAKKKAVIRRLISGLQYLMKKNGVDVIKGKGTIMKPGVVEVQKAGGGIVTLNTKNIIVATGSEPAKLPIPGADAPGVITSNVALELEQIPKSVVIIGGGPEGVEFANIFRGLGSDVTVLEMMPQLLPSEDSEIASELKKAMEKKGISVFTNAKVTGIKSDGEKKVVSVSTADGEKEFQGEMVLMVAGRTPKASGVGLENVGVRPSKKGISVDERMMTNVPGIYAVGDVAGKYLLAYTAFEEGATAAENCMGRASSINYGFVPRCIFTSPEIGAVGLNEEGAKREGYKVRVGRFPFLANSYAVATGQTEGFLKIIVDEDGGWILGVHIIGAGATELIHEAALALKLEAKVGDIASTLHAHPTFAEALKEASLDALGKAIHK